MSIENDLIKPYLSKCRMCLKSFHNGEKYIHITNLIKERFLAITHLELKGSCDDYSSIICETCDNELKNIQEYRKRLIRKQKKLINFVEGAKKQTTTKEPEDLTDSELSWLDLCDILPSELSENEEFSEKDFTEDDGEEERFQKFKINKYFCDICGQKTLLKSNIEDHMESHVLEMTEIKVETEFESSPKIIRQTIKTPKTYVCPCGKEFKYHSQFVDHTKRIHENIRDYSCQFCGKNYYTRRELSVHIKRVHMKGPEESVFCEICGNQYASKHSLRTHKKYHQQPQFVCSFDGCTKAFIGRQMLVNHEKIHRGQRDHCCSFCGKSFFSASHMRRHIAVSHQNLKIDCVVEGCNYAIGRKDYLRTHLLTSHKELHEDILNQYLLQVREMKIPS